MARANNRRRAAEAVSDKNCGPNQEGASDPRPASTAENIEVLTGTDEDKSIKKADKWAILAPNSKEKTP